MDEETEGHLGWFHILLFINNAIMNIRVHICFQTSILCSFEKISKSEISGWYGSSLRYFFSGTSTLFSIVPTSFYSSINSVWGFPCFHIFLTFIMPCLFYNNHSNKYAIILIYHCAFFTCISLIVSDVKYLFYVPIDHLYVSFGKIHIQILCSFF